LSATSSQAVVAVAVALRGGEAMSAGPPEMPPRPSPSSGSPPASIGTPPHPTAWTHSPWSTAGEKTTPRPHSSTPSTFLKISIVAGRSTPRDVTPEQHVSARVQNGIDTGSTRDRHMGSAAAPHSRLAVVELTARKQTLRLAETFVISRGAED